MNTLYKILIALSIVLLAIVALTNLKAPHKKGHITIGILQFASHVSLDAAREGFKKELTERLGSNVSFVEKNAQGDITQTHLIAQMFHSDSSIQGIYAIATPAAQACQAVEKTKPVFIAAVTDPEAAGLNKESNLCGTTDMVDMAQQAILLKELAANVKTVALLYNQSEVNATITAQLLEKALYKNNYSVVKIVINQESDVIIGIERALSNADAVLTTIDNSTANAMVIIAQKALAAHKPLVCCVPLQAQQGALAAVGVNYENAGSDTARIALEVLVMGKKPSAIGFVQAPTSCKYVNKNVIEALGLVVSENLLPQVTFVKTQK